MFELGVIYKEIATVPRTGTLERITVDFFNMS